MKHAEFSPSGLYRVVACPASYLEESYAPVQPASKYAKHGSLLHSAVEGLLIGDGKVFEQVSSEDQQYVMECTDYLEMVTKSYNVSSYHVENTVSLQAWGMPEVWGTPDIWFPVHDENLLIVMDWKFGSGVSVSAIKNVQGMIYLAAAAGYPSNFKTFQFHIVQPPLSNISVFELSIAELEAFVFEKLQPALENAKSSKPTYNPGDEQCRFCRAAQSLKCRAYYDRMLKAGKEVFRTYKKLPTVSPEEIAAVLKEAIIYEGYIKQLRINAKDAIMDGVKIPDWKLVAGRSIRKWRDEATAVNWMEANLDFTHEDMFKSKFISPSQAEKLNRLLKKDGEFQNLWHKPEGKPMLVKETDKRPKLLSSGASIFASDFKQEVE